MPIYTYKGYDSKTGAAKKGKIEAESPKTARARLDMLKHQLDFNEAVKRAEIPLRKFMLKNTRPEELALMVTLSKQPPPKTKNDVPLATLVPAFVLSQLRSAFIIGIVIFIPFLIIDLVVSAGLMSVGMMMVPPVVVSLPFKLLLFVLVDGWGLVINAVVGGFTV